MVSARAVAVLTTLATLGTASPALAGGAPPAPPVYPSLVNERLVRFLDSVAGERRMAAAGAELVAQ